jgi:hypothetical protein
MNVTPCAAVPATGCVPGVVKANVPGTLVPNTLAPPPLNVEFARAWPNVTGVAVGAVVIVGVALPTVTLTTKDALVYRVVSVGVKVTGWSATPTSGAVPGTVNANVPATLATPPLSVELANVCLNEIGDATGTVVIVGVALPTVTFADDDAVL